MIRDAARSEKNHNNLTNDDSCSQYVEVEVVHACLTLQLFVHAVNMATAVCDVSTASLTDPLNHLVTHSVAFREGHVIFES